MKRYDDGLEEDDVFFSERHCEPGDDARQNIEQFWSPVEFDVLVD